jgi:hypothetical protein
VVSGIWGLALNSSAIDDTPTVVNMLYNTGQILSPTVGFFLAREGDALESESRNSLGMAWQD